MLKPWRQTSKAAKFSSFLVSGVLVALCGCASTPRHKGPTKEDLMEARMRTLVDEISAQTQKIDALSSALEKIKKREELPFPKKTDPTVPTKKLLPPDIDQEEADELAAEESSRREEESVPVASSRHEALHLYHDATQAMQAKKYEDSVRLLEKFLDENPGHVYSDHAEYKIVESHYRNREYALAVIRANQLSAKYPYSFLVPGAEYLKALSFDQMGQKDQARQVLRGLLRNYPQDPVASGASKRLSLLYDASEIKGVPLIEER